MDLIIQVDCFGNLNNILTLALLALTLFPWRARARSASCNNSRIRGIRFAVENGLSPRARVRYDYTTILIGWTNRTGLLRPCGASDRIYTERRDTQRSSITARRWRYSRGCRGNFNEIPACQRDLLSRQCTHTHIHTHTHMYVGSCFTSRCPSNSRHGRERVSSKLE